MDVGVQDYRVGRDVEAGEAQADYLAGGAVVRRCGDSGFDHRIRHYYSLPFFRGLAIETRIRIASDVSQLFRASWKHRGPIQLRLIFLRLILI